jgi:hypothetical protein
VIDPRLARLPDLLALGKRELILGVGAALAITGLQINVRNGLSMLLLLAPVLIDCSLAFLDDENNLAFHDRIANTLTKKIFGQIQRNMRR